MDCIHASAGVEMFTFKVPYLGEVNVCWDCRRELALRTVEKPLGLVPVDAGRLGYGCSKCGGEFTSTDAMTCRCRGRRAACNRNRRAFQQWAQYAKLVLWKPKKRMA